MPRRLFGGVQPFARAIALVPALVLRCFGSLLPKPPACAGLVALAVTVGIAAGLASAAPTLPTPRATGWTVWQSEQADREGDWVVGGPNGAGERYLQPVSADAALTFPFELDRATTLRIRPIWWPTGEQKLARRFPYPLVRQPGPDAMDYAGGTVFATAPAAGRVIAIDAATEKPMGAIDVGGYLTDLIADRENDRICVADALGDRVVAIDANTHAILGSLGVPGTPWALALGKGTLYIACRDGKRVLAIDTATGRQTGEIALPEAPVSLELVGNPPTQLIVRFQERTFDVFTLEPAAADQLQYPADDQAGSHAPEEVESNGKLYVADAAKNRVLVLDAKTRKLESEISVPGQPWRVAPVDEVSWQRQGTIWPAAPVKRLYVACREANDLAVVSLTASQVVKRVQLGAEPRGVKFVPMPNPDWWPLLADDRIPIALQPRVAVELRPVAVDLTTMKSAPADITVPEAAPARNAVAVQTADGKKEFTASDQLVIGVDRKRYIDISALADPQLLPDPPLTARDIAGSITVSVDGGPEYDWAAARWIAPDSQMFLVNDSEEFWRYNAPSLRIGSGKHVLRVKTHSAFARLDAVAVRRSPEPDIEAVLLPEPQAVHSRAPLISYQGVFYDKEPALFTLRVENRGSAFASVKVSWSLKDYMGEVVQTAGPIDVAVEAGKSAARPIQLTTKEWGRYRLTVTLDTADGQVTREARFLRLPKLEHPRMFYRKDEVPAITARMARYPNLFRRYGDWLERMSQKEGRFPERFLPPGITADELIAVAPTDMPDWQKSEACAWRMYELGWRMLGIQFATAFLKPNSEVLRTKVAQLRAAEKTDSYVQFHHHGPFFPGAETSLVDWASDEQRNSLKLYSFLAAKAGDVNTLPWTLVTLEEPLTPEKRALIYKVMNLENNAEQYFETHRGQRGGPWWENPYTGCYCPIAGQVLNFLYLHNLFGEERLFEKPIFAGFLTFQRYADPFQDNRALQPNRRGPNGEPWRWIFTSLARHPLEKSTYQWDEWIAKLNGPMAGDEKAEVDRLMALDKMALTGPLWGGVNYFTSGVAVPIALALGWYEPAAPEVTWQELPPTTVFDVEGWVSMRSGWDAKATEVTFVSGVREHTTRHKPNHFTIIKGGNYLIGTPALMGDDGNNTGAWANSVVIGDAWRDEWALNLLPARHGEHLVVNRFSPAAFTYIGRDRSMFGYEPAEGGWGGGLDLHGHTASLFMREGRLLGYQTWPKLDFAAGDASNAWPADEVSQLDRQLVFIKPDVVVVYDRVKLGPAGGESKWIAATGPKVSAAGDSFAVQSGSERLAGRVLLPERAIVATPEPPETGWEWKGQKLLTIAPAEQSDAVEYLVVMRAGGGNDPLPEMQLLRDGGHAGVKFEIGGEAVEVRFNRAGPVGGEAVISGNGKTSRYELKEAIADSYANWQSDPRYQKWTSEPRFAFVIPKADRR